MEAIAKREMTSTSCQYVQARQLNTVYEYFTDAREVLILEDIFETEPAGCLVDQYECFWHGSEGQLDQPCSMLVSAQDNVSFEEGRFQF